MSTAWQWDWRFLNLALHIADWSKDPRNRIGCVITDADHNILATGYNGFPRGVADDARLQDRDTRLALIVHAEANAVCAAARCGHPLSGATAYVTRPTCTQCAGKLVQAGVQRVVWFGEARDVGSTGRQEPSRLRWVENFALAVGMLHEAGVETKEY